MIPIFIPSKDRAAQLDLLLTSIQKNANGLFEPTVMWTASNEKFRDGYLKVINKFNLDWQTENCAYKQFYKFLQDSPKGFCGLFADDCVFYRKTQITENEIINLLNNEDTNCFTFRMGFNITVQNYVDGKLCEQPNCYDVLDNKFIKWNYRQFPNKHDNNWGFPNAFDGCFYKTDYLLWLGNKTPFENIIRWEYMICHNGRDKMHNRDYMVSPLYSEVFCQQINSTHNYGFTTNGTFNISLEKLNNDFLNGYHISLDSMDTTNVTGCHAEIPFSMQRDETI